jgi:type II secretory pathway pseudopilin PulG
MELVVVMAILAALAGIVVPLLPNLITRAHTSSQATNVAELAKAIQMYQAVHLGYPNDFDSPVDGSGNLLSIVVGATGTDYTPVTLTDTNGVGTLDALASSGITAVETLQASGSGDWDPTFFPYGNDQTVTPIPSVLASGTKLAGLTGAAASREFGVSAAAQYVILGVGRFTTMQGNTLQEAPVHFDDDPNGAPNVAYARLAAVFQVTSDDGAAPLAKAALVGIGAFHASGLAGLNSHLKEYYGAK